MPVVAVDPTFGPLDAGPRRGPVLTVFVLALVAIGVIVGLQWARLADDPHIATAETVAGTVIWSNEETRLIAFEQDGVVRDPLDGDTIYTVIADNWEDVAGTWHSGGITYPTCLAGTVEDPVTTDRHRVQLDVIHRALSGDHLEHVAVHVRCLD